MLRIREFRGTEEDFVALAYIDAAADPEHPTTAEEYRYWYENFDTRRYVLRFYLAEEGGEIVGFGGYHHLPGQFHPQRFRIHVAVHPLFRNRGIGTALYEKILLDLQKFTARWLHAWVWENQVEGQRFLVRRGFQEIRRSWEAHLDVQSFELTKFQAYLDRAEREGVVITTLAKEKKVNPEWLSSLYELHTTVMADAPRSAPYTPVPLDHFRRNLVEDPDLVLDAFFIAKCGEIFIGESFVYRDPADPRSLNTGFTGVRREHRGKGIAMALKISIIRYAKEHGYSVVKTWNDTTNQPILAMNEKLGFVRKSASIEYLKVLE